MYPIIKTKCIDIQETDRYKHILILGYEGSTEGEELYTYILVFSSNMKDKK